MMPTGTAALLARSNGSLPLLHDIGDVLEVGILTIDADMTIRGWNHWLEVASGRPAAEVVDKPLFEVFPETAGTPIETAFRSALAGGTVVLAHRFHRYLFRFPAPPSGRSLDCMQQSARIVPMIDDGGVVNGAIALIEDVTERVVREAELTEAMARAQAGNQAKSDFLAAMSHELRTPIGAIWGYAELLADGLLGEVTSHQRDHLLRIKSVSNHLLRIVDEILTFARTQANREQVHVTDVDATEVAREAASAVEPLADKKGLRLDLHLPNEPTPMRTDEVKVRQILINLLGNAIKFTERGSVTLAVSTHGRQVRFAVADSGPGIADRNLDLIFEPFRQVEASFTRKSEGTGLGLAVSRQLARLLGGDVTVAAQLGVGSTFTLALPLEAEADASAPNAADPDREREP